MMTSRKTSQWGAKLIPVELHGKQSEKDGKYSLCTHQVNRIQTLSQYRSFGCAGFEQVEMNLLAQPIFAPWRVNPPTGQYCEIEHRPSWSSFALITSSHTGTTSVAGQKEDRTQEAAGWMCVANLCHAVA